MSGKSYDFTASKEQANLKNHRIQQHQMILSKLQITSSVHLNCELIKDSSRVSFIAPAEVLEAECEITPLKRVSNKSIFQQPSLDLASPMITITEIRK